MNFSQGLAKIKENEENRAKSTPIAMVAPELKQNNEDTEITKTCAVLGCEESKNLNSDSFFRFPEDLNFRQIWTDLTGRNNWTPTDYSYICVQHFSVDCFECDSDNTVVLNNKAVPSLKLPKHVLEVEYIDEETLDNEYENDSDMDYEMESDLEYEEHIDDKIEEEVSNNKYLPNGSAQKQKTEQKVISPEKKVDKVPNKTTDEDNVELIKLFSEVQRMQKQAATLKMKLKTSMRLYKRQSTRLIRVKEAVDMKKNLLSQRQKKKSRILLSLQDKIKEDTSGLVLAMPTRHTDDLKNFALSIYKYSPQAYIYIRNTLRTMLPSTDVLDSWVSSGYEPKNVLCNSNLIKVSSELNDTELSCRVSLR